MTVQREANLYFTLYPLFRSMQLGGLSPLEFVEDNVRSFPLRSFQALRIILNLVCMATYLICTFVGIVIEFKNLNRKIEIGDLIEAGYSLYGTVIPICIICILLRKRFEFAQFFAEMANFRRTLIDFIDCCYAGRVLRRMVVFYWLTTIFALFLAGIKGWRGGMGTLNTVFDFHQWGILGMVFAVGIQVYISFLNLLASAFGEILCSTLSLALVKILGNIQRNMTDSLRMSMASMENIQLISADSGKFWMCLWATCPTI